MIAFVREIWKILVSQTTNKLNGGGVIDGPVQNTGPVRDFRVGRRALEDATRNGLVLASNRLRLIPE